MSKPNHFVEHSFKNRSESKHRLATYDIMCQCMLCTRNCYQEKPNVFCRYAGMWESLYWPCCCTFNHFNVDQPSIKNKCKQIKVYAGECTCPRCCRICWNLNGNTSKCTNSCATKSKKFTPCFHFKGYCR